MERRNFLKGMLITATAGEAIIKLATPEETALLKPNQSAVVGQPQHVMPQLEAKGEWPVFMQDASGRYICVGLLDELVFGNPYPPINMSLINDSVEWRGHGRANVGMRDVFFSFYGVNVSQTEEDRRWPKLITKR